MFFCCCFATWTHFIQYSEHTFCTRYFLLLHAILDRSKWYPFQNYWHLMTNRMPLPHTITWNGRINDPIASYVCITEIQLVMKGFLKFRYLKRFAVQDSVKRQADFWKFSTIHTRRIIGGSLSNNKQPKKIISTEYQISWNFSHLFGVFCLLVVSFVCYF